MPHALSPIHSLLALVNGYSEQAILGRYSRDGGLNFVGRVDNQVKVSGVRIEPEEVEAALRKHPDVKTAAVSTIEHPGSGPRLAAWVVAKADQRPSAAALREFLTARLPAQIVPSSFAWVDNLPETPSGKIDRAGLAALSNTFSAVAEGVVEPRDDIESQLRPIWEEVLGVASIGVNQDFFDLGGHSLMAARLLAKIRAQVRAPPAARGYLPSSYDRQAGSAPTR